MVTKRDPDLFLFNKYVDQYPREAVQSIESSDPDQAARIISKLDVANAAALLERLTPTFGSAVISKIDQSRVGPVIEAMDPGHTATLLGFLSLETSDRLLSLVREETSRELRELMAYPADTAGALMDTRFATFLSDQTVKQALAQLQRRGIETDALMVIENGRLFGMVNLSKLVVSAPGKLLSELISGSPLYVPPTAPREDVAALMEQANLTVLPVADPNLRLLGYINHRSLVRAVKEEATVDIQTLVGASRDERALSSPWFAVRKRLPWLNVNLVTAFIAAAVVGLFEGTIAKFTALAVLLPVVAGQSGNTGAQALAVTMRGLALREIRLRHSLQVLSKEGIAGILNGVAVALVTCAGVYIWSGSAGLVLVIGVAMVISMAIAGLAGAAIPLVLSAFRQDPAQSGSIILTTVTDVVGFFSFLGLATIFAALL